MRMKAALLCIVLLNFGAAVGEEDCRCWTPSAQAIAALKAEIEQHQPKALGSLERYVRYYGGVLGPKSSRTIVGTLSPRTDADVVGLQIMRGKAPPLLGEGCILTADAAGRVTLFRCADAGAWTPTTGQVGELERALSSESQTQGIDLRRWSWGDFGSKRLAKWEDFKRQDFKWQDYERHYAGVTRNNRKVILGVFVKGDQPSVGALIQSEVELPKFLHHSCDVVDVIYDPATRSLLANGCSGVIRSHGGSAPGHHHSPSASAFDRPVSPAAR